jgi:hypothetical protein
MGGRWKARGRVVGGRGMMLLCGIITYFLVPKPATLEGMIKKKGKRKAPKKITRMRKEH